MEVKIVWDFLVQNSETIRNLVLIVGTPVAIILAVWRGMVAQRQSKAAQKQAEVAQLGLLSNRYQRAIEMLAHDRTSIRVGGIHALRNIAEEYPDEYGREVGELLGVYWVRSKEEGNTWTEHETRGSTEAFG